MVSPRSAKKTFCGLVTLTVNSPTSSSTNGEAAMTRTVPEQRVSDRARRGKVKPDQATRKHQQLRCRDSERETDGQPEPRTVRRQPSEALSYLRDKGSDISRRPRPASIVGRAGHRRRRHLGFRGADPRPPGLRWLRGRGYVVLAFLDLLPAVYTLSHREYAGRYLAARMTYGDAHARLHPFVVLVGFPALCFLALAYGGPSRSWVVWGLLGASAGLAMSLVRVHHARQKVVSSA